MQCFQKLQQSRFSQEDFLETLPDDYSKVATLESRGYLKNQLLKDADWASMAHSLELRTPFVDSHLLTKVVSPLRRVLGSGMRGKMLLGNSPTRNLPPTILNRPKTGFSLPMAEWIKNHKDFYSWKKIPLLNEDTCDWSRRWAYSVYQNFKEV